MHFQQFVNGERGGKKRGGKGGLMFLLWDKNYVCDYVIVHLPCAF
jgi:hypothetical protein